MQASEQLTIGPNTLAGDCVDCAYLNGEPFAQFSACPAGWAVRWLFVQWDQPGATTIHPTRDDAIRAIREWADGLDIVPPEAVYGPEDQKTPNDTQTTK